MRIFSQIEYSNMLDFKLSCNMRNCKSSCDIRIHSISADIFTNPIYY